MFTEDKDCQKLMIVSPIAINELKEQYKAKFEVIVNELKHFALKKAKEKSDEIQLLHSCLDAAIEERNKYCTRLLNDYQHNKKRVKQKSLNERIFVLYKHLGIPKKSMK